MAYYKIPDPEQLIPCPYDKVHMIAAKRMQYHLMKCRKVNITCMMRWFTLLFVVIIEVRIVLYYQVSNTFDFILLPLA